MKLLTIALFLSLFSATLQASPFVYVANQDNNNVVVLDAASNTIVTTLALPAASPSYNAAPTALALAPCNTTGTACVTNSNPGPLASPYITTISVLDTTLSVPILIDTFPTDGIADSSYPTCIAYTTDGNAIYVGTQSGYLYPITNITGSKTVNAPIAIPELATPSAIAIGNTPIGQMAYIVTSSGNIYALTIPTNTLTLIASISGAFQSIAIAPDGLSAYAIGQATLGGPSLIYRINTTSNSATLIASLTSLTYPSGIIISPNEKYLYATSIIGSLSAIPLDTLMPNTLTIGGAPIALAITADSSEIYVADQGGNVTPYRAPAIAQAGNTTVLSGTISYNAIAITPPCIFPPASANGCKIFNRFLLQTDFINNITWAAPLNGPTPAAYNIYRDTALTQLLTRVQGAETLQYYDHNRNPNLAYSYYIVSVDANGDQSAPAVVTVTAY